MFSQKLLIVAPVIAKGLIALKADAHRKDSMIARQ